MVSFFFCLPRSPEIARPWSEPAICRLRLFRRRRRWAGGQPAARPARPPRLQYRPTPTVIEEVVDIRIFQNRLPEKGKKSGVQDCADRIPVRGKQLPIPDSNRVEIGLPALRRGGPGLAAMPFSQGGCYCAESALVFLGTFHAACSPLARKFRNRRRGKIPARPPHKAASRNRNGALAS